MRTSPTEITYDETDHVGVITLNRPDARNALTFTTYAELEDAVRSTTARCLVITGADPAFCSGDDVKQIMQSAGERVASDLAATPRITPAAEALLTTDVPVIAAVNGAAVGWGMELAVMADLRVASERARFGELFVKRGLCCDVAGVGRLAQLVGRERTAELLFTGRDHRRRRGRRPSAWSAGSCPTTSCSPRRMALARSIASNPPLAVQRMKQGLRRALDPDWTALGAWVSASLASCSPPRTTRRASPPSSRSESRGSKDDEQGRCTPPSSSSFDGAVDADGHILEPPDLWERYLEPKYRDRALRFVLDDDGLEELEIGGKRSLMSRRGFPSTLGAMGDPDLRAMQKDPERTYLREAPFGSMDPNERLELLDAEGIDAAVLYTTVGLLWEAELDDPELSQAYTRAYNRWICEFCADSPRLVPTAHLSLSDPKAAAAELERAVGEGAKGAYVAPFTHDGRPLGHPDNDPVFDAAQGLGVPVRDPPHLRAAVDEGHAHGRVGERARAAPPRVGHRVRRRPAPVHDAVRLRRVRPLPAS